MGMASTTVGQMIQSYVSQRMSLSVRMGEESDVGRSDFHNRFVFRKATGS
jgi:hypothetical protein